MVGELIAGRYELEELVGSGGMSNVFRAHDRLLERTVALKILHEQYTRDEDYVERFRREARAVAQLTHPNIVTVIDRGEQDGRQFIVFEYVDGQNLKELSARGPLDAREAIGLALQVAHALSFAHARGLVHRDVKPQNVLLNDDGQAKVTDFGIARSLDVHGVTQTGTVLGTSDYIAPEQARGQKVDPKTDIYSLGVVLYELLTGEVPFSGDNFVAVAMRHVSEPPPSVLEHRPDCPVRRRPRDPACDGEGPGRSLRVDGRALRGARGLPRRAGRSRRRGRDDDRPAAAQAAPRETAARATAIPGRHRADRRSSRRFSSPAARTCCFRATRRRRRSTSGPQRRSRFSSRGSPPTTLKETVPSTERRPTSRPIATRARPGTPRATATSRRAASGLVLRAPRAVALGKMTVNSIGSDFNAEIKAGDSSGGPFTDVSGDFQPVGQSRTFSVDTHGRKYRYYLVWLKLPFAGGRAQISEVTAKT